MTKPTLDIWGANGSIAPLTSAQQAQGYAYTAAKPGQLSGTIETDDLDFPMKQVTTAIRYVLDQYDDNDNLNVPGTISENGQRVYSPSNNPTPEQVGSMPSGIAWAAKSGMVVGQTYTNNNAYPIAVYVDFTADTSGATSSKGTVGAFEFFGGYVFSQAATLSLRIDVPAGDTYKIEVVGGAATLKSWLELS